MRDHEKKPQHGQDGAQAESGDPVRDKRMKMALRRRKAKQAEAAKAKKEDGGAASARGQAGALAPSDVVFSTAEGAEDAKGAGNIFAEDEGGEAAPGDAAARQENPDFEAGLFDGKQSAGMEHAKPEGGAGEEVEAGADALEKGNKLSGLTGGGNLPEQLMLAAEAPEIILALQHGDYLKAFKSIVWSSKEQIGEALVAIGEKYGIPVVGKAVKLIVEYGTELNVLLALMKWTNKGLELIREAHERGDQETRIDLYADSFAWAFLQGEAGAGQSALRAVTPEEQEAVSLGRQDGAASAGATGELAGVVGKAMLDKYGSPEGAARHIKSHLLKEAGLGGQAMARSGA